MRPFVCVIAACLAALSPAAAADQTQDLTPKPATAAAAPAAPAVPPVPPSWDRPVIDFLRTPAILLLTPAEALEYDHLTDNVQRRRFIDRFWARVGANCTTEKNPYRDALFQRSQEAMKQFADEGVPGWITDRGRFYVLLGPPAKAETVPGGAGAPPRLVWTWDGTRQGVPATVTFVRDRLRWAFAGTDADAAAAAAPKPVEKAVASIAASYRAQVCELTAEERAAASTLAWRRTFFDAAGLVLAGQAVEVAQPLPPDWAFFPADNEATLVLLTVPLDKPLADGEKLVASLRREGDDTSVYNFGTDDVPFETRTTGAGTVAQAVRALPAGRYAVVLGIADAAGQAAPRYAAEQLVVRFAKDKLRMTSVIVAEQLKPLDGAPAGEVKPFRIGGYEVVPRPSRVVHNGETVTFFGVVSGAGATPDLKVKYQLQANVPGKGWINVGQPMESPLTQDVIARDLQIHPKLPPTDYKLSISVSDNKGGGTLTQDVPFKIRPKA